MYETKRTMTKLNEIKRKKNVHSHKIATESKAVENAFLIINAHLPARYMKSFKELAGDKHNEQFVKNVRNRIIAIERSPKAIEVLQVLLKIAKKNQKMMQQLSEAV